MSLERESVEKLLLDSTSLLDPAPRDNGPSSLLSPRYLTIWFLQNEGFGSFLQAILRVYLEVYLEGRDDGLSPARYVYTELGNFEHEQLENRSRSEWCRELNHRILNQFLPRLKILTRDQLSPEARDQLVSHSGSKRYLDLHLNADPDFLRHLRANYLSYTHEVDPLGRAGQLNYFDRDRINIGIHLRNFMPTDCDQGSYRELFLPGGELEAFYHRLIRQLDRLPFGRPVHFWLYIRDPDLVSSFDPVIPEGLMTNGYPNLTVVSEGSLNSDLYHLITSDLFVMSKSSLSSIVNYYRADSGLSLIRPGYWHSGSLNTLEMNPGLDQEPLDSIQVYQILHSCRR